MEDERSAFFHTSLVCLNGHILEDRIDTHPEMESAYCPSCSESTIKTCPNCNTPIRGYYEIEGVAGMINEDPPPNYCHACSEPYPWTNRHKEAARKMVDRLPRLSKKGKRELKDCIDDLINDTPEAQYSATRFSELMKKTEKTAGDQLTEFVIRMLGGISGEAAKRILSP